MREAHIAVALLVASLLPSAARADKEAARAHYVEGQKHYNLGRFQEASAEFEKAYEALPDPALLYNLAQCHRQLGNKDRALFFYRGFLRNKPNAPNRADVERIIKELEGGSSAAPTPMPLVTPLPAAPAPAPPAATSPAPPAVVTPAQPPPEKVAPPPVEPPPAAAPAPAADPAEDATQADLQASTEAPPAGWHRWAAVGLIGAGAVSLGVGIAFGLQADHADEQAKKVVFWTEEDQANYDSAKAHGKWAPLLMGVGGAAMVGGGVWAWMLHRDSAPAQTARFGLDVSNGVRLAYLRRF